MAIQERHEPPTSTLNPARSVTTLEDRVLTLLQRISMPLLQATIGLVFIWFGALKVTDSTPVGDLVAATVPFLDRHWFVPALGLLEVLLGAGLILGRPLRLVLPILIAHLTGTFMVLLVLPDLAFQHGNPLMLTTIGEFVIKNLVLIAGALVLASKLHVRATRQTPAP